VWIVALLPEPWKARRVGLSEPGDAMFGRCVDIGKRSYTGLDELRGACIVGSCGMHVGVLVETKVRKLVS
jgi:hypothetical protein